MSLLFRRLTLPRAAALLAVVVTAACSGGAAPQATTTSIATGSPTPGAATPVSPGPEILPSPAATLDLADADPLLTISLAEAGDHLSGVSSLATGDFNVDGVTDLVIGTPFADGPDNGREDAGEAFVVFGRKGWSGKIDLANGGEAALHILGARAGDTLGFSVAGGDLNGDGVDDIIVGVPGSNGRDNERTDLGEAYVIFGRKDLGGTVDSLSLQQDFTLSAAEGFARLGTSFAVADVNGDEIGDLIAGAPFAGREPGTPPGGPRTTVGEVYVVFGAADLGGTVRVTLDQQDLTLTGSQKQDAFGQAVAAADVNGDGRLDIIVGARGVDGPDGERLDAGAGFIFFGRAAMPDKLSVEDADLTVLGTDRQDGLGERAAAGDLNGDGIADIVFTARTGDGLGNGRSNSGEVYIILGGPSLTGVRDLSTASVDTVIYGPVPVGLMGSAVAIAELDEEGLEDLAIGAALASASGRSSNGAVYITYGGDLPSRLDLATAGDLFLYGAGDSDAFGSGLAVGDINGDGRPELIVAAPGPDGAVGKVYALELP